MVTHSFLNMFLIGLYQHYLSVGCEHTLYMEQFLCAFISLRANPAYPMCLNFFHLNPSYWFAPLYILRTASGRTDGDDVYGVMVMWPMTIFLVRTSNYYAILW